MFIQTEQTPNPATLKFLPGRAVMVAGTANFIDLETAARLSPLAERLFALPYVAGVFLGADFITVTKHGDGDWYQLKPALLAVLAVVAPLAAADMKVDLSKEQVGRAPAAFEPMVGTWVVAQDGGDIIFHDYEAGIDYLHMQGSCSGCPSSTATLKAGIENMLRYYIPEVVEVRAV